MKRVIWCLIIAAVALLAIQLGVRAPVVTIEEAHAEAPTPADSQELVPPAPEPTGPTNAEVLKQLLRLSEEVSRMRGEIDGLKAELAAEKAKAAVVPAPPPPTEVAQLVPAAPPAETAVAAPPAEEQPIVDEEQARIERERAVRSVERSGVLMKRGAFEVEPAITYSHASSNLISIDGFAILPILVIGDIQSLRVERDIFTTSLAARYGLLDNVQVDVVVPYKYERDRYVTQTETNPQQAVREETTIEDHGLGDVSFGVSYQAFYERGNLPDVILSARVTAPTADSIFDLPVNPPSTNQFAQTELPLGGGVWSVRGGVTAIKSLDPVVLIFNAGYTHSIGRDLTITSIGDTGGGVMTNTVGTTYHPGGVVDYGIAVAVAMNPVFAINLGLQQRFTFETDLDGLGDVEGSSTVEAELRFGFAWALTADVVLNFSAAAGLTEDTPDLAVTLALPIKF